MEEAKAICGLKKERRLPDAFGELPARLSKLILDMAEEDSGARPSIAAVMDALGELLA
jgi:hypothetical protein